MSLTASPDSPDKVRTLGIEAYVRLRADLIGGRLAPGEKLRLRQLSDRYGVGASGAGEGR